MSFVFPFLLGSLALVGIPVLIHLIMRQEPRRLPFPAFRFLAKLQRTNLRKLRLRHFLLLALRILLIASIGLALARPQVFHQGLNLRGDRPVAAVLVFDTSLSMEYKDSGGETRLEEAKKRGLELIDQLPDGSKVDILDTADLVQSVKPQWLQAMNEARERIGRLQTRPANAGVSERLANAFQSLAYLGRDKDDERGRHLPRLVFVFSDRTRASWDASRTASLRDAADKVPPTLVGLKQARGDLANLVDLLGELRKKLPPPTGKDYPEQGLLDSLAQLKETVPRLTPEDLPPDYELGKLIDGVRRRCRELIDALQDRKESADSLRDYQEKLLAALHTMVHDLSGQQAFFVDVGVDQPADLAVLDLALPSQPDGQPQQVFEADAKFVVRALVQATGKDVSTALSFQVAGKGVEAPLDIKAGQRVTVPFEVNCRELSLGPGQYSAEVHLKSKDQLLFDNSRYVTFGIREPRRILVLADDPKSADLLAFTLRVDGFAPDVLRAENFLEASNKVSYHAVFLHGLAKPSPQLWQWLEEYVGQGGGVAVIPGREEMRVDAYDKGGGQVLLPGTLENVIDVEKKPVSWNLDDNRLQHSALDYFWKFRNDKRIDFILEPPVVRRYWEVKPKAKEMVVVRYADESKHPAVLERSLGTKKGRVLMFTTPLDEASPRWNNYGESLSTFYLVLVSKCTNYLAGEAGSARLNFILGQGDPLVALPLMPRQQFFVLSGPEILEKVPLAEAAQELPLKQAVRPGNYSVTTDPGKFTARFSMNLPAEESDLTRVPVTEIDAVLGQGSVLPTNHRASIRDLMQDHWSEPVEVFPPLMVLLLFALALENLLANKFYKKKDEKEERMKDER